MCNKYEGADSFPGSGVRRQNKIGLQKGDMVTLHFPPIHYETGFMKNWLLRREPGWVYIHNQLSMIASQGVTDNVYSCVLLNRSDKAKAWSDQLWVLRHYADEFQPFAMFQEPLSGLEKDNKKQWSSQEFHTVELTPHWIIQSFQLLGTDLSSDLSPSSPQPFLDSYNSWSNRCI